MIALQAIVFDCDGVLFESKKANLAYYNAILEHFGAAPITADDESISTLCHTASSDQVLKQLLGIEHAGEALGYAATLDYRQFIPYLTMEPGLAEALEELAVDFPLALATNRGLSAFDLLSHFGVRQYFSTVVTRKDVAHPKPCPDVLHEVGRRLDRKAHEMLFVGDSLLDFEAARRARVSFVAYKGDFGSNQRVTSHAELVGLIHRLREKKATLPVP
jgi:HAD superfamily hydrolase (TIGR01509 family)